MKKKVKGGTVNIILWISFMFLYCAFIQYSYELFHWPRIVYGIITLILIPFVWSQPIRFAYGRRTLGDVIADKINKKYNNKDTDLK